MVYTSQLNSGFPQTTFFSISLVNIAFLTISNTLSFPWEYYVHLHVALLSPAVPLPRPFASGRHFQAGAPCKAGTWFLVVLKAQPRTGHSDKTWLILLSAWGKGSRIPPLYILLCQLSPPLSGVEEGRKGQDIDQGAKSAPYLLASPHASQIGMQEIPVL